MMFPSTSAILADRLGAADAAAYDLSAGCTGFMYAVAQAYGMLAAGLSKRALVVGGDVLSRILDWTDRSTVVLFGDGAGAVVLEAGGGGTADGFHVGRVRSVLVPDSVDALGYQLADDGYRVILSRKLPATLAAALPALVEDFCGSDAVAGIDAVALHPGGSAIVDAVARCLGLHDGQLAATRTVLRTTGNTSSAAIFFVLEALAASLPSPSGRGLVVGFGPGLTVELLELAWGC
jgi:3-oxoacyl-[acyl-carrier-protein] synthase III